MRPASPRSTRQSPRSSRRRVVTLALEAAIREYARLLLDTNLLIHEFKRQANVLGKIPRPQRAASSVAVWEFVHLNDGQLISHSERMARKKWMDQQGVRSVWFSPESEKTFHSLMWHTSCPAGVADCLLAAQSVSGKWPLVTRNAKHFDDVPGMFVVLY